MVCRLFGAMLLSEISAGLWSTGPMRTNFIVIFIKLNIFPSRKLIWKCRLQNVSCKMSAILPRPWLAKLKHIVHAIVSYIVCTPPIDGMVENIKSWFEQNTVINIGINVCLYVRCVNKCVCANRQLVIRHCKNLSQTVEMSITSFIGTLRQYRWLNAK